jgi:hypothetical protein
VTASVPAVLTSAPTDTQPPGLGNYICSLDTNGACGTTASSTTNSDGNAVFRYYLPGVVTPLWPEAAVSSTPNYVYPKEILTFSVSGGGCVCSNPQQSLTLQFFPRLWLNRDTTITADDAAGLKAVLSKNAATKKNAETEATDIITMLADAKILKKVAINQLKGLKDLVLSEWVDQLMRRTPELVKLDWFMSKFGIESAGLLDNTLDVSAFGQEIQGPLIELISGKFNKVAGIAFSKLSKKLKLLKTVLGKLEKKLDGWFKTEATDLYNQLVGFPFSKDIDAIVNEIIFRGTTKPRYGGTATVKLLDISTCSGQCGTEPLEYPFGYTRYKLFLLFSEVNKGHDPYSFPVGQYTFDAAKKQGETPITFNPQYWIPKQCEHYGCGPQVRQ